MKSSLDHDILKFDALLTAAESIAIITHTKPDGDAIGCCAAMLHTLELYKKKGNIVIANPAPFYLDFLTDELSDHIFIHESNKVATEKVINESDLLICLDFNKFHRTDSLAEILTSSTAEKVLIDHHLNPDREHFSLVFSETEISSACELLYNILLKLPIVNGNVKTLPEKACRALMTGMTTDTNNFSNSVYPGTLNMASALLEAGVDRDLILQNIYNRFKESRMRLMGHILQNLMKITDDGVAYTILEQNTLREYNVEDGDTEGFVNLPLSIEKVKMSILVKEDCNYARISIRSKKGVSANRCSQLYFNGGGHENAAGGRLYFNKDILNFKGIADYIENVTHSFFIAENENE